jgi:hypothetical protein
MKSDLAGQISMSLMNVATGTGKETTWSSRRLIRLTHAPRSRDTRPAILDKIVSEDPRHFVYLYTNLDDLFEICIREPFPLLHAEAGPCPSPLHPYSRARPASPKWGRSPAWSKSLPVFDSR